MRQEYEYVDPAAIKAMVERFEPGALPEDEAADCIYALRQAGFAVVPMDDAIAVGLVLPPIPEPEDPNA